MKFFTPHVLCLFCIFTEDLFKHLNVSSNGELAHILKCLEEDFIEDENVLSEEELSKLCSGINFAEEIIQDDAPIAISSMISEEDIPLSNITLGDELNIDDIVNNAQPNNILQCIDTNKSVDNPSFDLNLDELLNQPCTLSSQELKEQINNFLESDIAKEIEKVCIFKCKHIKY